jgi:hypothetical protein
MAHGNQLGGALGGLDAGDARDFKRIAFGVPGQRGDDFGGERTKAEAVAVRRVGRLAPTSTIAAWPVALKCERREVFGAGLGLGMNLFRKSSPRAKAPIWAY